MSAKLSKLIITRDKHTLNLFKLKNMILLPDLSITLFNDEIPKDKHNIFVRKVGVSLMYYLPDKEKNFPILIEKFTNLFKKFSNLNFILVPFLISKEVLNDDLWVSEKMIENKQLNNVSIFRSNDLNEILNLIPTLDLMIGVRLHANILSFFSGIPTIGVSYRK
jgi:polysaccharide pyruvyl transferase WcaK-like protein